MSAQREGLADSQSAPRAVCMLSVDVEDWFHLIGAGLDYQFRVPPGTSESWDGFPSRVEANTRWILDALDQHNARATFFVLGWVAERHPDLIREIHRRGHEVASHGYSHKVIWAQTPDEFRQDARRSVDILQEITGRRVLGFRASSASITEWAIRIIAEEGVTYDSSLFPTVYHDVYGTLSGTDSGKLIERLENGLLEVKFSSLQCCGKAVPWSGGGYFRVLPYGVFRRGVRRILSSQGVFQFYIHPWEVDSVPPRLENLKPWYRFRRYVSIERTRGRLERMLGEFQFTSISGALVQMGWLRPEQLG